MKNQGKTNVARAKLVIIFAFLSFVMASAVPVFATIPQVERDALIALYNSTDGDTWYTFGGWKTPPLDADGFAMPGTENTWYGITCDAGNTTVTQMSLEDNNLYGTIPPELSNLTSLISLDLFNNQISGSIPPELGSLANLTLLSLASNQLTGNIPGEMGNLTNLEYLRLNDNHLTGAVPSSITNLVNLVDYSSDFCGNHLFTDETAVREFLNKKQSGRDWESCQTRPSLGKWDFENNYDDSSGNQYHLTPYGTVPFVPVVRGGLSVDFGGGSTTYPMVPGSIDVLDSSGSPGGQPNVSDFNVTGMSIMGWLRLDSLSGEGESPIISQDRTSVSATEKGYYLGLDPDGVLTFMLRDTADNRLYGISQKPIDIMKWTHFALTWDGNYYGGIKMYENGSLFPLDTFRYGEFFGMDGDSMSIRIGASHGDSDQMIFGFDGQLDNLSLWRGVLTIEEIADNYKMDSDGDGIFDDGDRSGIAGDNPCAAGNISDCDDNCIS